METTQASTQEAKAPASRFFDINELKSDITLDEATRKFVGDGTPVLPIGDCKKVEQVRIGKTSLPFSENRVYVTDTQGTKREATEKLITLERIEGRPVLLRSKLSNFGIWQKGVAIYVSGEWDEAPNDMKPDLDQIDLEDVPVGFKVLDGADLETGEEVKEEELSPQARGAITRAANKAAAEQA